MCPPVGVPPYMYIYLYILTEPWNSTDIIIHLCPFHQRPPLWVNSIYSRTHADAHAHTRVPKQLCRLICPYTNDTDPLEYLSSSNDVHVWVFIRKQYNNIMRVLNPLQPPWTSENNKVTQKWWKKAFGWFLEVTQNWMYNSKGYFWVTVRVIRSRSGSLYRKLQSHCLHFFGSTPYPVTAEYAKRKIIRYIVKLSRLMEPITVTRISKILNDTKGLKTEFWGLPAKRLKTWPFDPNSDSKFPFWGEKFNLDRF